MKKLHHNIDPLDQSIFVLDSDEFEKFEKALAAAPKTADVVAELKKRPSPWRKE
jgi:hypothetical protein